MMDRLETKIDKIHADLTEITKQLAQLQTINSRHDELSRDNARKIEMIEQELHTAQGAIRLGKFVTAFVLSCIVGVVNWVLNYEGKKDDGLDLIKEQISNHRHTNERQDERIKDLQDALRER